MNNKYTEYTKKKKTIKVQPILLVIHLPHLSSTCSSFHSDPLPVDFCDFVFHLLPSSHIHSQACSFTPLVLLHLLHPYLSKHATRRSPWWFLYLLFSQASSSPLHGYHCSPSLPRPLPPCLFSYISAPQQAPWGRGSYPPSLIYSSREPSRLVLK